MSTAPHHVSTRPAGGRARSHQLGNSLATRTAILLGVLVSAIIVCESLAVSAPRTTATDVALGLSAAVIAGTSAGLVLAAFTWRGRTPRR